ncbi:Uma2 family endonuclease [Pseudoflavonifractor sp. 60]|uniref:Uma2 family endonuclease n=1 Tax=Pseudoflavonifractor sp. 60 TaxID=2304576 RepID=UPI00136D3DD2|nr:Uma2 family endonuclease [Pseudoflavonifractor sp. 60]NBI68572.1 Uma2 family endonuclease [Pseudoflavonifractor sp. 60]
MNTNLACPDEEFQRSELVGGKLVAMSPRPTFNHNRVAENIDFIFRTYLKGKKCTPFGDGYDLFLTDEDHFIPDFMVVCDRDKIKNDGVHGAPDLVVEVLSPSTVKRDRTRKKDVYGLCGVREYWLVDPAGKTVEVYRNTGAELVLHEVYAVYPDWMLPRLTESERAAVVTHFKCSLFDDLDIALDDIFSGLLPS